MFENSNGELFIYASTLTRRQKRLKTVSVAAEKISRLLKLNFEIKTFRKRFTPIYVYYKNGDEEPIPIYCSNDGQSSVQEI